MLCLLSCYGIDCERQGSIIALVNEDPRSSKGLISTVDYYFLFYDFNFAL